jgi:AraC family transcriptional regulator, exoenzyme S synthesis regulatory protein ExsA
MLNYYQNALTNPRVFKQLFVKELLFVYYDCPLGSDRQDSWSQYNYILYVVSGKKMFYSTSHSWSLTTGKAVFVKKGACIIEKVHGEILCLMAFFIPDNYLRSFLSENRTLLSKEKNTNPENEMVISLDVNDTMLTYYESVIPYFHSPVKPPEDLLELKFRELLFNIIGNPANSELTSFLQTLVSPQANKIQPIIEANYCYNLNLDDYAKLCNRSLSSFKRDFHDAYGESPAKWLLNKRLDHSLKLLSNSNKTIADISFESGFENSTHFSHAFRKHFGVSPLKYRQTKSTLVRAF